MINYQYRQIEIFRYSNKNQQQEAKEFRNRN